MKRIAILLLAAVLLTSALCGCMVGTDLDPTMTEELTEQELQQILVSPPILSLIAESGLATVYYGTASWHYDKDASDDQAEAFIACGAHPLELTGLEPLVLSGERLELSFGQQPDSFTVTRWSDEYLGDSTAPGETVTVENGSIPLSDSGYIYLVEARWEDPDRGYYGTADYVFYIISSKEKTVSAGKCGDYQIVIQKDGADYPVREGEDSAAIAAILTGLSYDPEMLCDCLHEVEISIDNVSCRLSLTSAYARCAGGQASMTGEQTDIIRGIMEKYI